MCLLHSWLRLFLAGLLHVSSHFPPSPPRAGPSCLGVHLVPPPRFAGAPSKDQAGCWQLTGFVWTYCLHIAL